MEIDAITSYVLAIAPSLTAIFSMVGVVLLVLKRFKDLLSGPTLEIKELKKAYKEMFSIVKSTMEQNVKLADELKTLENQMNILRLTIEEKENGKEQLHKKDQA